ncbi:hypothetical protein AHAS_Ahas16G0211900 [Arachis hypogaea]
MSIMPMAEDILMYTADQRNIQFVDEVYSIVILSCMPLLTWPCAFDWILRRRISLLVYEYIENENLGQYLHGTGREPLAWSTRVQIALDSARGIEYIHEHTVPVYIHRDVKPANILIYKDFREKVANFGLTKLWEVGSSLSLHTRLVRTFGYMPPV